MPSLLRAACVAMVALFTLGACVVGPTAHVGESCLDDADCFQSDCSHDAFCIDPSDSGDFFCACGCSTDADCASTECCAPDGDATVCEPFDFCG